MELLSKKLNSFKKNTKKTEKEELNKIYEELKKKRLSSGCGAETYTTGYRNGHTNGQIELLERILGIGYCVTFRR